MLRTNTNVNDRIRTLPIEIEKVTEIEGEKEILSLFPLGFPLLFGKASRTVKIDRSVNLS